VAYSQLDQEVSMTGRQHLNRRQILRGFGATAMAAAFGPLGLKSPVAFAQAEAEQAQVPGGPLFTRVAPEAKVSLVKGNDRRDIVYQALKNIEDEVLASIGNHKKILIKPNFVATASSRSRSANRPHPGPGRSRAIRTMATCRWRPNTASSSSI
jgi:hypothetical protein